MKKGQIIEGKIERVDFPNRGILTAEGKTVIVKNGIEGQTVQAQLTKVHKGICEARILSVIAPSPAEKEPDCPHFSDCGGCAWRTLPYSEELAMKERQIRDLLEEACEGPFEFEGIFSGPRHDAYRNKMEFSFGDEVKDGPLALGMHKRGSFYDIVTVDECRITDEDYHKILRCVLDFAAETGLSHYHRVRHDGYFRHLLVRKGQNTGEILIDLVTSSQGEADLAEMTRRLLDLKLDGTIRGILHTVNDSIADVIQSDRTDILWGEDFFYDELLGLRFKITPFSFFQTNTGGAAVLYEKAREYLGDTKDREIFDLYSGTGTIAQVLAPAARHVTGVEIVEEAVIAARENAKMNGLTNCDFIAGDVLKVIDGLEEKPDLIVLDPPRDGIHPKALGKIIRYGVDSILYISCKATSLARDLGPLQQSGYRVVKACAVDLFPGTANVEVVSLLQRMSNTRDNDFMR